MRPGGLKRALGARHLYHVRMDWDWEDETIPDVVGPITAWRAWAYDRRDLSLGSLRRPRFRWMPGENRSMCLRAPTIQLTTEHGETFTIQGSFHGTTTGTSANVTWSSHATTSGIDLNIMSGTGTIEVLPGHADPTPGCGCGFWGLKELSTLQRYLFENPVLEPLLIGRIEMWGVVVPGSLGYRAQHARVVELMLPLGAHMLSIPDKHYLDCARQYDARITPTPLEDL